MSSEEPVDPKAMGYYCEACKSLWLLMRYAGPPMLRHLKSPAVKCCGGRTLTAFADIETIKEAWEKEGGLDRFLLVVNPAEHQT